MLSSILKIIPKLDTNELNKMERSLQSRFTRVAKRFGKGIGNIFTKGGPLGVAIGFLANLLNPLKEIQESMDRTLQSAGDIATNAKQFGTTSGRLAKLSALGQAKGIDQDALFQLISKFQGAVAQAEADPSAPSAVRQFVGQTDAAEGFFTFIQALKSMEKNQQILVQQQVFGEKQVLKMASFLQSDFGELLNKVAPQNSSDLTRKIENLDDVANYKDILEARRGLTTLEARGSQINRSMYDQRDAAEKLAIQREGERIKSYKDLAAISTTMDSIKALAEQGIAALGSLVTVLIPKVNMLVEMIQGFTKSSLFKGIFKFGKGD